MREAFEKEDYEKLLSLAKESRSSEASFYLGIIAENGLLGDVDLDKAEQYYLKAFHNGDGLIKAGINLARVYQKHYKISDAENIYNQIISLSKSADNISLEYAKLLIHIVILLKTHLLKIIHLLKLKQNIIKR